MLPENIFPNVARKKGGNRVPTFSQLCIHQILLFWQTGMVDADGDGMLDYSEFVQLFTDKLGLQWKSKAFKQKQKNYILMKKLHNFKKWLILEPGEQWKRRKVQII